MSVKTSFTLLFSFLCCSTLWSQTDISWKDTLYGKVVNERDVEGIVVVNYSQKLNTITLPNGSFEIQAKLGDTISFSSLQYETQSIVLTLDLWKRDVLEVLLVEEAMEIEPVVFQLGLSGNLSDDLENIEVEEEFNFDDVGIPGFQGVHAEKVMPVVPSIGLVTAINIDALYKHLSGYYRKLRLKRRWEKEDTTIAQMVLFYSPQFFMDTYQIPEHLLYDFMLKCAETTDIENYFLSGNQPAVLRVFDAIAPDFPKE